MKIGILHNCQNDGIAAALRALLPDAGIINFHVAADLPAELASARAAELNACDHVVITTLEDKYGQLSQRALQHTAKKLHVVPHFAFAGFHPDMCYASLHGEALPSPTGGYHSRIAIAGFLADLSAEDTAALYNRLVFRRLGYFDVFAEQTSLLIENWAAFGVDAAPLLENWLASGCFCTTVNHPKMNVLLDIARIACGSMGLVPDNPDVDPATLPDRLGRGAMHPVFPDIAAAIGVAPEGSFASGVDEDGMRPVFTAAEFVRRCFAGYADVPVRALLQAAGVEDAMQALGLKHRPRSLARARPGPAMVLMTAHGTVLRAVDSQIVHLPLSISASDAPFLRADCTGPGTAQSGRALISAHLRRVARPHCVAFGRNGVFLCAERDTSTATFSRNVPGDWESFLPLADGDIAVLNRLREADWHVGATGEIVPRQMIRVMPGPRLQFGRWAIDLVHDFPQAVPGDLAAATLLLDGETCTIREMPAGETAASLPAAILPEPGDNVVLAGLDVWLPPPVTVCAADRAWLYRVATQPALLNGQSHPANAVLRREADQVVWPDGPAEQAVPPLAGLSIRFCPASLPAPRGWMDAAISLHLLGSVAPQGAGFLLPRGIGPEILRAWIALGFQDAAFLRAEAEIVAQDLLWLGNPTAASLPAEALRGFRARIGPIHATGAKLCWLGGLDPAIQAALAQLGFITVDPAEQPIVAQIAVLSQASFVVGRSLQIPLAFCHAGTRIIELCSEEEFAPDDWMLCAKLGLSHAVLPCAKAGALLAADPAQLSKLITLMASRLVKA